MRRSYEISVSSNNGKYFARLETETHYAVGEADTPEEAVQRAAFEANYIIREDYERAQDEA